MCIARTELALPGTSHPPQGTRCPAGFLLLTKASLAQLAKWVSSFLAFCLTVLCQMHRHTIYSCYRAQFIKKYKEFPSVMSPCAYVFNHPSLLPAGWELSGFYKVNIYPARVTLGVTKVPVMLAETEE